VLRRAVFRHGAELQRVLRTHGAAAAATANARADIPQISLHTIRVSVSPWRMRGNAAEADDGVRG
jgi:hypothetical protein